MKSVPTTSLRKVHDSQHPLFKALSYPSISSKKEVTTSSVTLYPPRIMVISTCHAESIERKAKDPGKICLTHVTWKPHT